MTEEHRREHHAANAATGLTLMGAGEGLSHAARRQGTRGAKVAAKVLPRGLTAVGIPLAATGTVGALRGRGRTDSVDLSGLPEKVARRTVEVPGRVPKTQRAKDATLATLAGGAGGALMRHGAKTPRGRALAGATGMLAGGTSAAYGAQKAREANRRKVAKAQQKTIKIPAPTVNDTVEDWKIHNQRRHAANYNAAATGVGAAALAARGATHLAQRKPKLVRFARHGNKASAVLGGVAAGAYTVGGAINYKTQRHDLRVQRRRLVERDQALQGVRKDRFTDKYAQHISPSAERGYNYLRNGRNTKAINAVEGAIATGGAAALAIRGGKVARPAFAGVAGLTGAATIHQARGAHRWNGKMKKIKAKAYERAGQGVYGRGREVPREDLAKALLRTRPPGLPFPKGLHRAPTMRAGSVRRTASGKMVAFRGAYG